MRKLFGGLAIAAMLAGLTFGPAVPTTSASATPRAVWYEDSSGSNSYFLNTATPVVANWYYDAGKNTLTVNVTLKGALIGSVELAPGNNSGTITGTVSGDTAELQVGANFNTHVMGSNVSAWGVNGNRQTTGTGNF